MVRVPQKLPILLDSQHSCWLAGLARLGLGAQIVTTKTLRRRFLSLAGRLTHSARRLTLHLPQRWPWENQFSGALARLRPSHSRPDGAVVAGSTHRATHRPRQLAATRSARDTSCLPPIDPAPHGRPAANIPCPGYRTLHAAISIGIKPSPSLSLASHPFSDQHSYIPSVDSGLR